MFLCPENVNMTMPSPFEKQGRGVLDNMCVVRSSGESEHAVLGYVNVTTCSLWEPVTAASIGIATLAPLN